MGKYVPAVHLKDGQFVRRTDFETVMKSTIEVMKAGKPQNQTFKIWREIFWPGESKWVITDPSMHGGREKIPFNCAKINILLG